MENDKETCSILYHHFFSKSSTAMAILDREGQILAANKKFESILENMSPKIKKTDHKTRYFPLFWSSLLPLAAGQHNYALFESSIRFIKNGKETLHWFSVHAWRIKDDSAGGETSFIGLSLEDNTLLKQEERKLLLEKETTRRSIEAKDQFLANMSHEIRTPIQTIIGMTELLQETRLDHEQSEYSKQVKFSATILLSLINDILDYSKIEAGKMELENIDFDLEDTIEQAVEMIALEAHKKDLYIATCIPLEANIIINGDPGKFRQIIINLVKNAVKFTHDGGILVSVSLDEYSGAEGLTVSVTDTGIGISKETRQKLFSTFVQADASNTRRFGGTGLGLAISRNLVELMKGRIETIPNKGKGSTFRFTIPLRRSENMPPPLPHAERDGKLRILVTDNCLQERKIIVSYLGDLGYINIDEAETGESALKMMRAAVKKGSPYQLCFLNMLMPVMDGWRLAAEIHNDDTIKSADLILMVPHGLMGADAKMTLLKWFKAYINKPIKRRRLADTISAVFGEVQELEELEELDAEEPGTEKPGSLEPGSLEPVSPEDFLSPDEKISKESFILIAEDHLVNQKLFAVIIEKLGCRPVLADNGQEAIKKISDNHIDLVFMDIQMPEMTGHEAAKILRSNGFKKPIIAVTASALSNEREICLKAGMNDILFKPFLKSDIEKMLQKWLSPKEDFIPIQVEGPEVTLKSGSYFNAVHMFETFMGEKKLALSLLSHFLERTNDQIESIRCNINGEAWEKARIEAHTIKGAAFTMGGTELGNAASRLEKALKNIERDAMEAAYPVLKDIFACFKKEAEDYIKSTPKE